MRLDKAMENYTNAQLQTEWERGFEDRVKSGPSKGCIKLRSVKRGDKVLAEAGWRGLALQTPAKYQ